MFLTFLRKEFSAASSLAAFTTMGDSENEKISEVSPTYVNISPQNVVTEIKPLPPSTDDINAIFQNLLPLADMPQLPHLDFQPAPHAHVPTDADMNAPVDEHALYQAALWQGALEVVLKDEPVAFRSLEVSAGLIAGKEELRADERLTLALRQGNNSKLLEEAARRVEKRITKFIVLGYEYTYTPYSAETAEKDVLTATDGINYENMRKQWSISKSEWAQAHRDKYKSILDNRKDAFNGIISPTGSRKTNNCKSAKLSSFYKKIRSEAHEEMEGWMLHRMYPQYV